MSQAASQWYFYYETLFNLLDQSQGMLLDGDQLKMALFTSSSNAINRAMTPADYASFNNEVAAANGYSTGGVSLGNCALISDAGTIRLITELNGIWTPTGGGITFRAAVIYHVTSGQALCYCLADSTPANVTAAPADGKLVIAAGVFAELVQQNA